MVTIVPRAVAVTVLPRAVYPAGTRSFGPVSIPVGLTSATVLFDLSFLTALTMELHWTVEYSLNNGISWIDAGGGGLELPKSGLSFVGPTLIGPEGAPVTQPPGMIIRNVPEPTNPTRLVRGTMRLTEPFETIVTVTVA